MDASSIIPGGWHFLSPSFTPDRTKLITPLARIDHPVRYIIIDYDCSVQFVPGQSPIIEGLGGRDNDPPELVGRRPFDHFKLDVFTLGNVFRKDLRQVRPSEICRLKRRKLKTHFVAEIFRARVP